MDTKEAKSLHRNFIQQTSAEPILVRIHPSLALDRRLKGEWLGLGEFKTGQVVMAAFKELTVSLRKSRAAYLPGKLTCHV